MITREAANTTAEKKKANSEIGLKKRDAELFCRRRENEKKKEKTNWRARVNELTKDAEKRGGEKLQIFYGVRIKKRHVKAK